MKSLRKNKDQRKKPKGVVKTNFLQTTDDIALDLI